MPVSVSGGSLDFISTLNNDDFQAKSLQDIRLINERLKLTGDVSGISKYDEAVKSALSSEAKLRSDLNKILDDARAKAQQLREEVERPARLGFSAGDTAAELEAANAGLRGLANGDSILADLKTQFAGVNAEILTMAEQLKAGEISEATYNARMVELADTHRLLGTQIERVTAAYSGDTASVNENTAATQVSNTVTREQIGLRENLIAQLKILKTQNLSITDPTRLAASNKLIEEAEADLKRMGNAGKRGYDEVGNAIEGTNQKQGKFGAAITRATSLSNIGATVVSRLSRQIIGLGVAYLSLEIGAKAIKSLIEYISQLNIFNPIASEAAFRSKALQDAFASADYTKAVAGITELRVNLDLAKQGFIDKDSVIDEYNKTLGKVTGNVDTLNEAEQALTKNADKFIKITLLKAAANIVLADAAKNAADTAIKNQKLQDDIDKLNQTKADVAKNSKNNPNAFGGDPRGVINAANASIRSDIAEINENNKRLDEAYKKQIAIVQNFDKQSSGLLKDLGQKATAGSGGAGVSAIAELRNKLANDTLEKNKLLADNIMHDDQQSYAKRLAAINDYYNASKGIAANNEKLALSDKKLSADQKLHIENEYNNAVLALQKTREQQIKSLNRSDKSTDDKDAAALRAKIALMQEVSAATASFNQKELNADQAAIAQVTNKFEQLKAKISAFNADPRHANHQITQKTLVEFQNAENSAIDNQQNINENQYIQTDIEKKKKLYADYEAYRQKVGATTADKEYANLLLSGKDFETYLTNIKNSIDKNDVTAPIEARRLLTQKEIDDNAEAQKKAFTELLIETATYEQKREGIIQVGSDRVTQLIKAGKTEQAHQEAINTQESLDALAEEQFKKLDAYKHLYTSIDRMSTASAQKEIAKLYTFAAVSLATGKISINAYNAMIKAANSFEKAATDKLPEGLKAIGSELQNIASEVSGFDSALSNALKTVGSIVSGVGSIKANLNTINDSNSSTFSKVTAGLGIVGTAIGVVSAVAGLFSHAKEKAAQEQYNTELQQKAVEAVNKALERQLQLVKEIYGPERITAYLKGLADIKAAQESNEALLANKLQLTGNKAVDDQITKYNSGQSYNHWILTQQFIDSLTKSSNLAGKSLEDLQKLMDQGKLDAGTAAIVQSLVDLQQKAIDTQNALNQEFTGSTFDEIKSDIQSLFESSTTSAEDWGNNFEKIIQKSVEKGFETKFLDAQLQGFYDDLAKFTKNDGGILSKDSIQKLQDEYNTIIKNAQTEADQIKQQTGISISTPGSTPDSTLTGQIKGITSEEAGLLVGQFNGQRVATIQTRDEIIKGNAINSALFSIAQKSFDELVKISANTFRTANNTDALADVKISLASIDKKMSTGSNALGGNGR